MRISDWSSNVCSSDLATTKTCYPAKYTESGDLILPENFHEWVYVGSPLTPNALNGGQANFPEFHNVYIEPCSYEVYRKTNVFPWGTVFLKELQLVIPPSLTALGTFSAGSTNDITGQIYTHGQ